MPRYAISDIHGCSRTFRRLVDEQLQLQPSDQLYLLGDYIDRGPDSKGVIDFILELRARGCQVSTLMGNHEAMLLETWEDADSLPQWLRNGGEATLASFGLQDIRQLPETYRLFLDQLEYYLELPDYLLVHAGFDFSDATPLANLEAMLWIRKFTVDPVFLGGRRIVHGHTPTPYPRICRNVADPKALVFNIDGGCVYKQHPDFGFLTALDLDTRQLHVLANCEG